MTSLWERFTARIDDVARRECQGQGYVEVSVTLSFLNGKLLGWQRPGVQYYEPRSGGETLAAAKQEELTQECLHDAGKLA